MRQFLRLDSKPRGGWVLLSSTSLVALALTAASPAFGPCGIPEAELPLLEVELDELAAGAEDEDFDEDEPPPQPATAMAATARRRAIRPFAEIELMFMVIPLFHTLDG